VATSVAAAWGALQGTKTVGQHSSSSGVGPSGTVTEQTALTVPRGMHPDPSISDQRSPTMAASNPARTVNNLNYLMLYVLCGATFVGCGLYLYGRRNGTIGTYLCSCTGSCARAADQAVRDASSPRPPAQPTRGRSGRH